MRIYDANEDSASQSWKEDSWYDYVDWKELMYKSQYTHVTCDGLVYPMTKWGPGVGITIPYRVVA